MRAIWVICLNISKCGPRATLYHPDRKIHGANMGPTWVLSAPDGPHVGPMNLAIRAMLSVLTGTVFLWIYWPSFNAALAPGDDQHRAVINTYLALASCCVTTFMFSSFLDNKGKFDMVSNPSMDY